MLTRRNFIRLSGTATAAAFFTDRFGFTRQVFAQIPGGTLDPLGVTKYVTPLLVPPAMPRAGKIKTKAGKNVDYYEIAVRQLSQQILPAPWPATTVWGYGPRVAQNGPQIFNAPSLTIEVKSRTPVRIKWINELRADPNDATSAFLRHLLPVDPTLHWANPPGGTAGRDTRPTFSATPDRYRGPVPIVTHVHGAVGVGDESDGYAEAWFLPQAGNIPSSYATVGTWYDFFKAKAAAQGFLAPGTVAWEPGTSVFEYPNNHRAATLWYHDHTLGMTRLNVYAGPAGFYLVRGGPEDAVVDARTGRPAVLPGPAPALGDPAGTIYYEVPIAVQDRAFNTDGSLFYPARRDFFDQILGPYVPFTDISPIWNPEFFGNMIMVNGNTWPFLDVEQRRYRFRFLNGCQSRFLILDFGGIPGVQVWQIGNEGGLLPQPLNMMALTGGRLLMGLAERADVIVDFTNVPLGQHLLANRGPDEPFKGFNSDGTLTDGAGGTIDPADPETTGQVMAFNVVRRLGADLSTPPQFLQLPAITPLPTASVTRNLALLEELSTSFEDAPVEALLGTVAFDASGNGTWTKRMWEDAVTENPQVGATEVWELYNATADAHPMHIHEATFEVVNRQAILIDEDAGTVRVNPASPAVGPQPWERGFKDTVIAYPGQVTRVRIKFDNPGQFVWHCHIVEHEDNEMMRPYRIGPIQSGQPG